MPGDELDEVVVSMMPGGLVKDAGLQGKPVRSEETTWSVVQAMMPLHAVAGVLHGDADIVIAGGLTEPGGEVHHGDIVGGGPGKLMPVICRQLGMTRPTALARRWWREDDVAHDAAARAPVPAGAGVHGLLGGGGDGAHEGLLDAEVSLMTLVMGARQLRCKRRWRPRPSRWCNSCGSTPMTEGKSHVVARRGGDDDLRAPFSGGRGGLRGDVGAVWTR